MSYNWSIAKVIRQSETVDLKDDCHLSVLFSYHCILIRWSPPVTSVRQVLPYDTVQWLNISAAVSNYSLVVTRCG